MDHVDKQLGNSIPQYASTHPANKNRIAAISEWIPDAEKIRQDANCEDVCLGRIIFVMKIDVIFT
jgi:predicted Zn-dependent protease